MSAQTDLTKFDGVLITIRSKKSFFEVTKAIESSLQRFSTSKLAEYVTHADREGLEAYVEEVSAPSKFSIFWEMEQGSTMRLAGIPLESKFYLVGTPSSPEVCSGTRPPLVWERRCVSVSPSATVKKRASTWTKSLPSSANFLKRGHQTFPSF